jgi:alpha-glucosidase
MAREESRQYFGLGDKTGPLNLTAAAAHAADGRARLQRRGQRSAVQALAVLHRPRPALGHRYGIYYDTQSTCAFDFGAEYDNYHGFYSTTEIENGDLDY